MVEFFDHFAGIGGVRLGLERLGWRCVGYCEIDKYALQTYRANFPTETEWFWEDARSLPVGEMPDFDVLCAGFPCQPWSAGGLKKGFEDARGTLFFEIARVLKAKRPEAFLLENVKGLTFEPMQASFNRMTQILQGLGYAVFRKVLNSLDFGVAQNRERVFFVGFRHDGFMDREGFAWPAPSAKRAKLEDVLEADPPAKYRLSERLSRSLTARMQSHGDRLLDPDGWAGAIASSDSKIHGRNLLVLDPNNQNLDSLISPSSAMRTLSGHWGLGVAINATNPHSKTEERAYHGSETARTLKAKRSGTQEQVVLQVKRFHADAEHELREYEGLSPTLTGQMGTGGWNVPLVVEVVPGGKPRADGERLVARPEAFTLTTDPRAQRQAVIDKTLILRRLTRGRRLGCRASRKLSGLTKFLTRAPTSSSETA